MVYLTDANYLRLKGSIKTAHKVAPEVLMIGEYYAVMPKELGLDALLNACTVMRGWPSYVTQRKMHKMAATELQHIGESAGCRRIVQAMQEIADDL